MTLNNRDVNEPDEKSAFGFWLLSGRGVEKWKHFLKPLSTCSLPRIKPESLKESQTSALTEKATLKRRAGLGVE